MKKPEFNSAQARAFPYAMENPYSILALAPRLGKSRIIIEIREQLQNNCLIICPSHLILNWVKEIRKWAGPGPTITAIQKGKDIYEICDTDYAIISYDLAKKAENFFEWADMLAIDESHHLKSMDSIRSQFIHRCIYEYGIKRVHPMTGTPIKNRVREFYSLLAIANYDPRVADSPFLSQFPSEIDFADHFSHRKSYVIELPNGHHFKVMQWKGIKNTSELKTHLRGKYIRIRSDEVDLPPIMYKPILISNSPNKQLLDAFNAFFEGEDKSSVGPKIKAEAALNKVPFTIKYAEDLLQEVDSCLIYSDHVLPAEAIAKHFGVRALTGAVPSKIRSQLADKFQAGEGRVLVATVGALKEGRDLYRANDIILNDFPWVPGDLEQVINRIRTIGKKNPCMVHEIFGSPQDEYITETLKDKMVVIEQATSE